MLKTMERNKQKRIDKMNKDEINLIRRAFKDNRTIIEETPDEIRRLDDKYYQGGSVYTTEDGEFIDLEIQERDYDIEDHVNYIEFAEQLYDKHKKRVNVYVYCVPSVKINIKMYKIQSDANFKIILAQVRKNSMFEQIKSKLRD